MSVKVGPKLIKDVYIPMTSFSKDAEKLMLEISRCVADRHNVRTHKLQKLKLTFSYCLTET